MITFRIVRWKNLLSTGNYWTEIKLTGSQNTLIVGENGSGKSTILDALCFGLFGKAFRNINKPNLQNSINQKDCRVEVEFDTNNKSYKIVRGIKPNLFEIYCDNELLNQDAASKDYQDLLEKSILKFTHKSFTQIVILGSASFTPFMQLTAADRRAVIEDLLDIQIFSVMNQIVKDHVSNNKDLTISKKYEIDLSQQKYDLTKNYIEQTKQDNERKIESLIIEIDQVTQSVDKLLKENIESQKLVESSIVLIDTKNSVEGRLKKMTKLESQIENNRAKLQKDIEFFTEHDNCPTCRQAIDTQFKQTEIANLSENIIKYDQGMKELEVKILKEQEELNKISQEQKVIQNIQVKIATNSVSINETNKYIEKLRKQIEELKKVKESSESQEKELEEIRLKLEQLQNELKELIELKSYYEVALSLLKDTGIKAKVIRQYIPVINKLVNKYLASMDFFVNFNLDESFKETIKSRFRDEFSYHNFSEGEKQRIDMALLLTWRAISKLKNSANTNLLILDEIFDSSLDGNGTEYLMNILRMLEGTNLFVISHKGDILQDKFNHVIKFQKVKNFSRIVK